MIFNFPSFPLGWYPRRLDVVMRILNIVLSIVLLLDILGYVGYIGVSTYWIYVVILLYVIQQLFVLQRMKILYTYTNLVFIFILFDHSQVLVDGDFQEMSENRTKSVLFIGICSFGIVLRQNKLTFLPFSYIAAIIVMLIMYQYDLYFGIVGGRYSLTYVNPNKFGEVLVILTLIATKLTARNFLLLFHYNYIYTKSVGNTIVYSYIVICLSKINNKTGICICYGRYSC